MASKAQSIRVGLFALATLVLLGIVLIIFGGVRLWESSDHYRIVFSSSVMGLEPGAVVYLNGIKVGTVDKLAVVPEDIRQVAVTIKVKHGTPVHADTQAMLQYAGITGLKVIDLRDGTSGSATLPPDSQIAAGKGLIDKLEAQAQTLADQSTQLLKRANQLTDNLVEVTAQLGGITDPAKRAAEHLAAMTGSLQQMVGENRAGLRASLAAIQNTAHGASDLIDGQASQLFGNASEFLAEMKKLISANEAPLRAAVFDLRQASRNFKELSRDVRQKPSRLLFSNNPAERQLP
jgi:phospholipid/cholesterol/gamma-HCH transport system substrate-binding protein